MAAQSRRSDTALSRALLERGYEFRFFQAVRLLARIFHDRDPVPAAGPRNEVVRFRAKPSLSFPPSDIHALEEDPYRSQRLLMTVAFMGLYGPNGVLPQHYTSRIIARNAAKDTALAAFLDMFNHRLISWFYRAWEKHHVIVGYERQGLADAKSRTAETDHSRFTHYLFDLIGMGTGGLRGRMGVPDNRLLFYAGLIAQKPHSASALTCLLRDYFGVRIRIQQFCGGWLRLKERELSWLRDGAPRCLGKDAIAGDAVWDLQTRFRVDVGPVSFRQFLSFLPGASSLLRLTELTRFFTGEALDFQVRLILRAPEVPWPRLIDEGEGAPRLGLVGWLKTEEFVRDADDVELTCCAAGAGAGG